MKIQETHRSTLVLARLATGILLIFFFVQTSGVNVPVNDDWDHLNTSLAWKAGGIDFQTLLALHNEHCLAVSRIWNHLLLVSTSGDFKAVLLANSALAALLLGLVLKFVRDWKLPMPVFLLLNLIGDLNYTDFFAKQITNLERLKHLYKPCSVVTSFPF
jgi:hypothetical protein